MAARRSLRYLGFPGAKHSKNTLGRTHSRKHAGQRHKPKDVFRFPDNSDVSSMLGEMEEEEESYESFDPPLHSTAIDAEEELSKHCGSSASPATHGREESRRLSPSENEASGNESTKTRAKKPQRKLEPISDEFESSEDDVRRKVGSTERTSARQHQAPTASPAPTLKPVKHVTPERTRPHSTQPCAVEETGTVQRQLKTRKKVRLSPSRRKKSRREATDSDASESMHIWCLEGKRCGDIMELDVILSAFEKIFLEYKQRIESERCSQAINEFYFKIKGELIRMLKEVQVLKALKRRNAKIISDMEKKRQRLIEVQDELLRLEPQLKQLQTKHDNLKERKLSLKNSMHFLSNLKQLHHDYSEVREKEPKRKEKYDSSSLPALLFKARTILGAEKHLKTINCQLGKLLEQE
ncbi:centromere protein U isoform X2 [Phodopus roborovskii]|uniref:centromere protein U isoform X2 n=1 Tax=Phodopus roborovskii TaxID=109678 RepID=UPI0021E3A53E|nr:centromere protein U isoform X2 [Phodopus roborovskii]